MIENMKKLTFLVTSKEYDHFLSELRRVGVVHIAQKQQGSTSDELQQALAVDTRFKESLKVLEYSETTYAEEFGDSYTMKAADPQKGKDVIEEVEELKTRENTLLHQIEEASKNKEALEPWGEFSWETLSRLEKNGYKPWFFSVSPKLFKKEWVDKYFATIISEDAKKCYFVTFGSQCPDISAERIDLPAESLSMYVGQVEALTQDLKEVRRSLFQLAKEQKNALLAAKIQNENDIDLSKVHLSTESIAGDAVKLMVGWVLEENAQSVCQFLDDSKIYYEVENPAFEDDVPIKLKNSSYTTLFEPILKMYSLPNYQDLDVTPFLAPFFMLFFGLCMGDAGYGLLILLVSVFLHRKLQPEQKGYAKLGVYLGGMTLLVGILTGSFFGIDLSQSDWAFLAPVKHLFVNEKNYTIGGYSPMMVVSVIIGLVQVLLGMVLAAGKAMKNYGWRYGIGKLSWVVGILASIVCFGLPACGVALPSFLTYVLDGIIALAVFGIFFLNSPKKNAFMNFGIGLWDTYGMATGLLGDLLSYIRLFALGLTGGVLGGVFNELAIDLTSSMSWGVRWLPMLIILLLGHGINFGLCMISSFVHPMRLTFVEFFKNADFAGGGKEYDPFRMKKL